MFRSAVLLGFTMSFAPLAWSQVKIQALVEPVSYARGLPNVGSLASIYVSGLTGAPGLYLPTTALPLPFQLAGINVTVDGVLAPILAVYIPPTEQKTNALINIQVPLEWNTEAAASRSSLIVQESLSLRSDEITPVSNSGWWGGFFSDQDGFGFAQHTSDNSPVTRENPAHAGETIAVLANGLFRVWPPAPIGFPTPPQPVFVTTTPYPQGTGYLFLQSPPVTMIFPPLGDIGSCASSPALKVTFEGLAPGFVGVEQIQFVVPANQQPGDWALFFNIGTDINGQCPSPARHETPSSGPYVKIPVR